MKILIVSDVTIPVNRLVCEMIDTMSNHLVNIGHEVTNLSYKSRNDNVSTSNVLFSINIYFLFYLNPSVNYIHIISFWYTNTNNFCNSNTSI